MKSNKGSSPAQSVDLLEKSAKQIAESAKPHLLGALIAIMKLIAKETKAICRGRLNWEVAEKLAVESIEQNRLTALYISPTLLRLASIIVGSGIDPAKTGIMFLETGFLSQHDKQISNIVSRATKYARARSFLGALLANELLSKSEFDDIAGGENTDQIKSYLTGNLPLNAIELDMISKALRRDISPTQLELIRSKLVEIKMQNAIARKRDKKARKKMLSVAELDELLLLEPLNNPEKLQWRILPPGEHPFTRIMDYFEKIERINRDTHYDRERLKKIYTLNPVVTYVGMDEFQGYVVFYFDESQPVILDCPVIGNAIYVISGDWKTLSGLTKNQLLKYYSSDVTRVVHSGDWFSRLKESLSVPNGA